MILALYVCTILCSLRFISRSIQTNGSRNNGEQNGIYGVISQRHVDFGMGWSKEWLYKPLCERCTTSETPNAQVKQKDKERVVSMCVSDCMREMQEALEKLKGWGVRRPYLSLNNGCIMAWFDARQRRQVNKRINTQTKKRWKAEIKRKILLLWKFLFNWWSVFLWRMILGLEKRLKTWYNSQHESQ